MIVIRKPPALLPTVIPIDVVAVVVIIIVVALVAVVYNIRGRGAIYLV